MKKIIGTAMSLILSLGLLAGCGAKAEPTTAAAQQTTAQTEAQTAAQTEEEKKESAAQETEAAAEEADDEIADEDVEGELVIYTSMYPFAIEMMDQALKAKFPNLKPGNDGSFFYYSGTSALITKIYGEMGDDHDQPLDADMFMVAEPAFSLELKDYEHGAGQQPGNGAAVGGEGREHPEDIQGLRL